MIVTASNISGAAEIYKGLDELGTSVDIPVDVHPIRDEDIRYYLYDRDLKVYVTTFDFYKVANPDKDAGKRRKDYTDLVGIDDVIYGSLDNPEYDTHVISTYNNVRKSVSWWKEKYSLTFNDVICITHCKFQLKNEDGVGAARSLNNILSSRIFVYEDNIIYKKVASAFDVLAHELAHCVFFSMTGIGKNGNYNAQAFKEAYSDIFACIQDENWLYGENAFGINSGKCERNIANTQDTNAQPQKNYYGDSLSISHAAYLMKNNGLTWDELADVWFESMVMGLYPDSKFNDVRRCVVWAAQKLEYSDEQLAIIKAAFDEVGIKPQKENYGTIKGTITESPDQKPLENVEILTFEKRLKNGTFVDKIVKKTTAVTSLYEVKIEAGNYHLTFDKKGYKQESFDVSIKENENVPLDVALKKLNSISGTVRDGSDENKAPLGGVSVQLFEKGMTKDSTTTVSDGSYLFELNTDKAGDYTLTFSLGGYKDGSLSIHVDDDAGEVSGCDIELERDEEVKISGVVKSSPDMELLPDATVQIFEGSTGGTEKTPIKTATTDSSGAYSFTLNENGQGTYTMVFSKTGYKGTTISVTVKNGLTVAPVAYLEEEDEEVPIDEEHFPDANFRSYVKDKFDKNNDDVLNASEIEAAMILNLDYYDETFFKKIYTLKGIEYLKNVIRLYCSYQELTELDLSRNTELTVIDCSGNKLTSLTLKLDNLYSLKCSNNKLTNLDISKCSKLNTLDCSWNQLTSLDTSNCTDLTKLSCVSNQLTSLNLSHCPNLNSDNVTCDSSVTIIWTSTTSTSSSVGNASIAANGSNAMTVIASIPTFTATHTGEYVFDVSLDKEIPEDSRLILLNESEDLNGVFISGDKNLKVSADFEAGQTYAPVIVAKSDTESESSGGGCNAGVVGFALMFVVIIAKRRVR